MRRPLLTHLLQFEHWRQGEAWATLGDFPVSVFGAGPGDLAVTQVAKRRKGVHPGWVESILQPSSQRVEARCSHFGACGGCSLQHLAYSEQLDCKTERWERALQDLGAEVLPVVPSPLQYYYRTKVEFSFDREGRPGFNRRRRFDQVVAVDECLIAPLVNRQVLARLRGWSQDQQPWSPRTQTGYLRYFILRCSNATGQWLAVLVTSPGAPPVELAASLEDLGATGVIWAEQTSTAAAVNPDREHLLRGRPYIEERLGPLRFELSWRSFFQSNPQAYLKLLETARGWIGSPQRVLDLFCGIGSIGLYLADKELVGVESVEPAVLDARRNAQLNQRQAEFHWERSENWTNLDCELLVLDPPRSGCHSRLLHNVNETGPARILYISCNPDRFIQELEALPAYRAVRSQCFDFFPQTPHFESMTLLQRCSA